MGGTAMVNGLSADFATSGIGAENEFAISVGALIGLLTVADKDALNGLGEGGGFTCDSPYVSVSLGSGGTAVGTVKDSPHVGHCFVLPTDVFFACRVL